MAKHQKPKPSRPKPKPAPVSDEVLQSMIRPKTPPPLSVRPPPPRIEDGGPSPVAIIAIVLFIIACAVLWAFVH